MLSVGPSAAAPCARVITQGVPGVLWDPLGPPPDPLETPGPPVVGWRFACGARDRVISDCHKILGPIVTFGDRLSRLSVPIVTAIVTGVFR
jgi:hypothetical protein